MSQQGPATIRAGGGGAGIETLTGNSGGAVGPDALFNIDVLGSNMSGINIVGTPASNLLSVVGIQATTTQRGTVTLATNAQAIAGTDTINVLTSDDLKAKLGTQTAHSLAVFEGSSSAVTALGVATNGQLPIGSAGADPVLANITSTGGTITITNGPGSINLDLAGGQTAFDQIAVDAFTAPGTNPVLASAAGQLTLTGAQVATGTIGANVIRSDSLAANSITLQIQRSTAVGATDSTKNGVSHFDSAKFTVDANGFVSASGTGLGQTITGNSGGALSPTAGNWNILGASTAAGTSPVTTSGAASTLTVNVQKSQAIAATDATKIGLAAFNSSEFTVDANGFVSLTGGGVAITTINGDTGSITGSTVTIYAHNSTRNCGNSVLFSNSGTTSTLNVTDISANTLIGNGAGNAAMSGGSNCGLGTSVLASATTANQNVAMGVQVLTAATTAGSNVALGEQAMSTATTATSNVAVGSGALVLLTTGGSNTAVGVNAGSNYTSSEGSNIVIGNLGTAAESHVIRIGTQGSGVAQQNQCFIAGIVGVTSVTSAVVAGLATGTGQLVQTTITAGAGITVTPSGGIITIAAPGSGFTWSDQTGSFTAAISNGYFITGASTPTLPASPSEGDTVAFVVDNASTCTITGNTGQKIRLGAALSAAAGTCANNARGDTIELVYRSTGTTWFATSSIGTWTIT